MLDWLVETPAHERDHQTTIDATRKKRPHRYVADQMRRYCIVDSSVEALQPFLVVGLLVELCEVHIPIATFLDAS